MDAFVDNFYINVSTTIRDIDATLWNEKIGRNHVAKSHEFLNVVENNFPSRQYFYYRVYSDASMSKLVALFFSCQYRHDFFANAQGLTRSISTLGRRVISSFGTLPIAMTGNPECHSQTWWLDESSILESEFYSLSATCLALYHTSAWLRIIRDFIFKPDLDQDLHHLKPKIDNFSMTKLHPIAEISIKGHSAESYKDRLKQNYRRLIRKALSDLTQNGFQTQRHTDFQNLVEDLYPLYINVHYRAREYVREPFPKCFFQELAKSPFSEATVIYDVHGDVAAFTISVFNAVVYNPYIFGSREIQTDDPNFYYGLMWFDLENACHRSMTSMDMGITNYFPKQNFGAQLLPLAMAVSVKRPFSCLSSLIAKILTEPQPAIRNGLK